MMAVNRYRIKNLADSGNRGAKLILKLLAHPDQLLGTILFGNNVANIAASTLATVIGLRLFGDLGLAYAPLALVFIVLIFAEVAPKTVAALYPERIAFPAAYVLIVLQWVLSPFIWLVKILSNGVLRLFGVSVIAQDDALTSQELRAAVKESGGSLNHSHKEMLLRILEMEEVSVEDLMVPRAKIEAIDLDDDWEDIVEELATSRHTRVPVYRGSMDNFVGIIHLRKVLYLSQGSEFTKEALEGLVREPYFIPENSLITQALQNLQDKQRRFGVVVNEYGDIKGLITLEQILEEIVGKFTAIVPGVDEQIHLDEDGTFLVHGNTYLRDINRKLKWQLPTKQAKTLNGLIVEQLENIPHANTSFRIENYIIEIVQTRGTSVHIARLKEIKK